LSKYKALIVQGGWDGHEPKQVAEIFLRELTRHGFDVIVSDTLDSFKDPANYEGLSVVIPIWTMGTITGEQAGPLYEAVRNGVGIAGCHGGMGDAFRNDSEWNFMTGGQFVSHPGGEIDYTVKITDRDHYITRHSAPEFAVRSEQYYMHVDPAIKVQAITPFPTADGPHVKNGAFNMPVVWTKFYGEGRVAYNSLGHNAAVVEQKEILPLIIRGVLWAAHAEKLEA
jgi:hypothetical protein